MSFFKSVHGKAGRFMDRLRLRSSAQSDRSSSPLPTSPSTTPHQQTRKDHHQNTSVVEYRPSEQLAEADSIAPDISNPLVALHVTSPSRSPSPVPLASGIAPTKAPALASSVPPTPFALISGPGGQLAIFNNNSNVNHNAPGGTIVNNNSVIQVVSRDQAADDMNTIEKCLGPHHVSRALYDAQPLSSGCMEGTRVQLLNNTQNLLISLGGAHIVWIAGMAGTGKTSIALTLCRRLVELPVVLLGGTFFCSRSAGSIDRTDARRIIPTLASLLARQVPMYAQALAAELKKDPDRASKAASLQIQGLLTKPLESVGALNEQIVFVIDALDECSDQQQLAELINALADINTMQPVKFLLTSRPELHIRDTLITDTSLSSIVQLHMVEETLVTADIRLYIQKTFETASKASIWYTDDDLDDLAAVSGGLFIYASTALAYILKRRDVPGRSERLKTVKMRTSTSTVTTGPLDKMYSLLLTQASNPDAVEPTEMDETLRILSIILSTRTPLTINTLAELLGMSPAHLRGALDELHAVIFVPDQDDEGELRTVHASFGDFIFTRAPEHIRIAKELGDEELARACLYRMAADDLCFNVSRSHSSYEENPKSKPNWIAHSLIYACLHWAQHIALASSSSSLDDLIDSVLRLKLLFWLELLSVLGEVGRASGLLRMANVIVMSPDVSRFLRDANSFITSSHEAIKRSAPHIYLSALPFAPTDSLVRQTFFSLLTGVPVIETLGINRIGGQCVMVLTGHTSAVSSVAYSPNGKILVSGSQDETVQLWDTRSGAELRAPLESSNGWITSVVFTPNGDRLVAGTKAGSVIVWDTRTGRLILPPLHLHTDRIRAVVVSPDGGTIASASYDSTVALCHPNAERQVGNILRSHDRRVHTVAFSPDGKTLASAGESGSICYWNYRLGQLLGHPLQVSQREIFSIAFSQDGSLLASGSADGVVRVWDVRNARQVYTYSGHQSFVMDVAFAPDGHTLASAYHDFTVHILKLRDTDRQSAPLVLRGHSDCVNSVSFSKDGQYVTSGSDDGTIRVWNVSGSRSLDLSTDGHTSTNRVHAVAFSCDGRLIASASADGFARVWEAQTCQEMYSPLSGHNIPLQSIAFSLDGHWIATGSADSTVRLWSAQAGQLVMPELRGHTSGVISVLFSPTGRHLASLSYDETVRIWDLTTEQPAEVAQIQCDGHAVCMAYSPNGTIIALGGSRGRVQIFNALTGQRLRVFPLINSESYLTSLVFSPDGTRVLIASYEGISSLDVHTGQCAVIIEGYTVVVAHSSDGQFIVSGGDDGAVRLWSPSTHERLSPVLFGHAGKISSIAVSTDGRFLVTGSDDKTVRRWDLERARSLADERDYNPLAALALAQYEGNWLISPSKALLLWVPIEYRGHLEIGGHSRVLATHRVIITTDNGVTHQGEQWTRCWRTHDALGF